MKEQMKKIVRKLYGRGEKLYYDLITIRAKREFDNGTSSEYRYIDESFFYNKTAFDAAMIKYEKKVEGYWNAESSFNVGNCFSERYINRKKMITEEFLPLFENKPDILDIGCADGAWSALIADNVNSIDGYDYSQKMVENAQRNWGNLKNCRFYQGDARTISIEKTYDGAMMLGLLMYIDNIGDTKKIIANIFKHLKPGGYLIDNNTINRENRDTIFLLNKENGYNAEYWSIDIYHKCFEETGFILFRENMMDEVTTRRMHFQGIGTIWKKPETAL